MTRPPAEFNRKRTKSAQFKPQGKGFGGAGLGGAKRAGSVRDQKLNKLNEERLEKERARMKVAYDHAKMWFGEIKKALEKDEGFFLEPSLGIQI